MGYGAINHPIDRDPICGYTGIIGETCPRCGRREGEGVRLSLEVPEGAYGRVRLSDGWRFEDGGSERGLASGEYLLARASADGGERA